MKKNLLLIVLVSMLSSCMWMGLNIKRKTPHRAGRYPAFSRQDSIMGYLYPERDCYQPYYYNLQIRIEPAEKKIYGIAAMHFMVKQATQTLMVNLHPNMILNTVSWRGKNVTFTRKHNGVWINFPETLPAGNAEILEFNYEGNPEIANRPPWEGGFVWKKDEKKRDWAGVACELSGASMWWPLKDHLTAEPDSVRMTYIVPKGLSCVSNGVLQNQHEDDTHSYYTWFASYPINTYNVTFYLGYFKHFSLPYDEQGKKQLHFYVLDYNLNTARSHFQQTKSVIKTYENLYGTYPFWRDDFKLIESPYEGMEHQTAIAYGNGYKNNAFGIDYIILHETAHEWWGNAISVADYKDIWIQEGMATYSEALYMEENYGTKTYESYLYMYSMFIRNKKPMVGPPHVNYWNYKDSDPYMKGALMMHSLRTTLNNDTLFFAIIRNFYEQYKFKPCTSQNFIDLVNQKTGLDYSWFFQQYLYNRKAPVLEYCILDDEKTDSQKLKFRWKDTDTTFRMPVLIRYTDGNTTRIYPQANTKEITIYGASTFKIDDRCAYFRAIKRRRLK